MLINLRLKNLALIEIIEINFEKGLNILTGDSGSGKSLILDSLNALFGGSNIPLNHLIRPGKQDCLIEAKFSVSSEVNRWLIKKGFQEIFSELKIKRISYKKNHKILSKYSLNEFSINKKLLEELGFLLIDFAGQSDSRMFESQELRRLIIDDLGTEFLKDTNLKVKSSWKQLEILKGLLDDKLESLRLREELNKSNKEMLNILDQANLKSCDEISELQLQENKLANIFQINSVIESLLNNFNNYNHEKPSVGFLVSQSLKTINKVTDLDIKIQDFKMQLDNIQKDVEALILNLNSYIHQIERTDVSLEQVQNRLFFLKNLERNFNLNLRELIQKRDQLRTHFSSNSLYKEIKSLEEQVEVFKCNLNSLFISQSSERKKIARNLEISVLSVLKGLGLENANFSIKFDKINPTGEGIDNIDFLFSANPDQKLATLSKVISGGEMSRFLLAIKSTISQKSNTFFLDEIDSGLSGKSLFALLELIKAISLNKQVLCITHQPSLAAAGRAHFKVMKNVIDGKTFTSVSKLTTKQERQDELVELIGGGFGEANDYASILLKRAAA